MVTVRKHLITAISVIIVFGALAFLCLRVRATSEGASARSMSRYERSIVARGLARREQAMRVATRRHFPGDAWSADDDFHNMEQSFVRTEAASQGVSPGEILRAIDDDLRENAGREPNRRAGASPCKPRPFYD